MLRQIKVGPGLDGIMYDEPDDKIILTNHSRPIGTLTALDPKTGDIVATVELEDTAPEGAAADGKGHIFVNNESKNTIQVIDVKTWKATASWPLAPCEGPTGIAYDKASESHFLRLQQDVGRRRPEHAARSSRPSRTARAWTRSAGIREKTGLHPQRRRGQRHGRAPGLARLVHGRGHGADVCRREDHRGRSGDAQRVSLPARARPGPGATGRRAAARTWRSRPRTWSTRPHRGLVVHRHQAVASRSEPDAGGELKLARR